MISRATASRLCTRPELDLVDASYPANAKLLSPGRLRQKVGRARKLRDKYRDLARRQRSESRGKSEPRRSRPAAGHDNTTRKAELFAEVLDRFEAQLERSSGQSATIGSGAKSDATKAGAKQKPGAKKTGAKKTGAKKTGAKKTGAKKTGAKKTGAKKTGATEIGRSPAGGQARPAAPGRPGAAAMKGARQRPDAKQQARGRTERAHNRAAGRRSQKRRDAR
jgi:hypothetical protein